MNNNNFSFITFKTNLYVWLIHLDSQLTERQTTDCSAADISMKLSSVCLPVAYAIFLHVSTEDMIFKE